MAFAVPFLPWIAAGVAATGAIYQGNASAAELEAQADTAKINARLTRQKTDAAEEAQRRRMALARGEQRAAAAESGFDPSSGSLAELQVKSAGEMELDALTARYEGTLKSISFENEAKQLRASASGARTGGYLTAAATLLSAGMSGGAESYNYRGTTLPNALRGGA